MHRFDQISLKEYGASFLLQLISPDITQELENNFPEWKISERPKKTKTVIKGLGIPIMLNGERYRLRGNKISS